MQSANLTMASFYSMSSTKLSMPLSLVIFFFSLQLLNVSSFEFEVGGSKGWVVPPANDTKVYNDWASENRFQVGDTVRFKYRKDSVMEVAEADYKKCNSSHPNFFSNTGNTVLKLEHPGPFYFISGVSGHCHKGQRMIVKVMSMEDSPTAAAPKSTASPAPLFSKLVIVQFVLSYAASCFF